MLIDGTIERLLMVQEIVCLVKVKQMVSIYVQK